MVLCCLHLRDGIHGTVYSTNQLLHPVTKLSVLMCLRQMALCCAALRVYVNRLTMQQTPHSFTRRILVRLHVTSTPRPITGLISLLAYRMCSPRAGARVYCSTGLLISTVHASLSMSDRYMRAKSERLEWARENLQKGSCRDTKSSHSETCTRRLDDRKYFF